MPAAAAQTRTRPARALREPSTHGPVYTGVIDDLTPQIDAEPKGRDSPDLLDPDAPKE